MDKPLTQAPDSTVGRRTHRRRITLLAGLLALVGLLCWSQWRALASTKDTYATALRQLDQMRIDKERIEKLRRTPRTATSRTRPNEELLAQIEQSLEAAGIDRAKWHDSVPQPAVRLPRSDYKRMTTRLYFEAITVKQLAAFAHHLQSSDPTLHVSAVNLTNRHTDRPDFDVDLAVSYLVYAPQEGRQTSHGLP